MVVDKSVDTGINYVMYDKSQMPEGAAKRLRFIHERLELGWEYVRITRPWSGNPMPVFLVKNDEQIPTCSISGPNDPK